MPVEAVGHADALRVVGDGDVLEAALPGPRRPSPRASLCRRWPWCACAGRRGCRRARSASAVCRPRPSRTPRGPRASPAGSRAGPARRRRRPLPCRRCIRPRRLPLRFLADAKHAVLVDLQPAVLGHAAEDHVVVLRAGEVLQRRAERLGRHDAQVDLQAAVEPDRHLRVAAADQLRPLPRTSRDGPSRRRRPSRRPASRDRRSFRGRGDSCRPLRSASRP